MRYAAEQENLLEQNRVKVIEFGQGNFRPMAGLGKVGDPSIPVELIHIDE
jgi:hypothetical protein